mgnify:FL=1
MKKAIILTLISITISACSSSRYSVYKPENTYSYQVIHINDKGDTLSNCSLQMSTLKNSFFGKAGLRYDYEKCGNNPAYYEITSYIDNEDCVELHPPRMGMLSFTAVLPYPNYHYPEGCVVSINGETYFEKTTFAPAKGKTISYKSEQEGSETLLYNGKEIECYTIKGENTSHIEELGQYRVKYFFNTTLGFVRWEYFLPNNEKIILQLK